jgi:hypothetical protein
MCRLVSLGLPLVLFLMSCGDDGSAADRLGIGAECTANDQCDVDTNQRCLLNFKGGYCGLRGCAHDTDCPSTSACIAHDDGEKYCFRICAEKTDCNRNRSVANEANCSSSITFVDGTMARKACVPPSGT